MSFQDVAFLPHKSVFIPHLIRIMVEYTRPTACLKTVVGMQMHAACEIHSLQQRLFCVSWISCRP